MDAFEARIRCLEIASDLYGSIGAPYTADALLSVADLMWGWFMAISDDEPNVADEQPITETRQ